MPTLETPATALSDLDAGAIVATYSSAVTFGSPVTFGIQQQWVPTPSTIDSHKNRYRRDLFFRPRFQTAKDQLERLATLHRGWDSYGGEPPNAEARNHAERVLGKLERMSIPPSRVVASAEGGVAICFVENSRYADIECLNSGEILAVTYVGAQEPLVWEVSSQEQAIQETVERIGAHFAA